MKPPAAKAEAAAGPQPLRERMERVEAARHEAGPGTAPAAREGVPSESRRRLLRGLATAPAWGVPAAAPAWLGGSAALIGLRGVARAADAPPKLLRIGVAQPAVGQPPSTSASSIAVAHAKGWIDEALAAQGTEVRWAFFKGAGPAVNEALTTGQLDFAAQGDLPAIVARAAGLTTRLVVASGVRTNIYLAVPPGSDIQRVEDLRGRRVALFKGTNMQLPVSRVLEAHGLTERDLRALNLDTATTLAALASGDIDAAFGSLDLLKLRDRQAARIVFSSKGRSPIFTRQSHVAVTESFARQHPQTTQALVDAVVKTAHWASEEVHREEVLQLWARAGTPYRHWVEDYEGEPLRQRLNPSFDPFLVGRYREAVEQAQHFRLTRRGFDVESWIDRHCVADALRRFGLERYWPSLDEAGRPTA